MERWMRPSIAIGFLILLGFLGVLIFMTGRINWEGLQWSRLVYLLLLGINQRCMPPDLDVIIPRSSLHKQTV
jgi:hypothetical protein